MEEVTPPHGPGVERLAPLPMSTAAEEKSDLEHAVRDGRERGVSVADLYDRRAIL